jgi:hypothetical protein
MSACRPYRRFSVLAVFIAFALMHFCTAQQPAVHSDKPREMLMTEAGLIAVDTPEGWERADGPGLAFFLPKGTDPSKADVWIYLAGMPVGAKEDAKNTVSAIESDISEFRKRFKNGTVREEKSLTLPRVKQDARVYTFESGEEHNSFEQVVYIADDGQVLTLTLSARNRQAFDRALPVLKAFAESYGGTLHVGAK